ncbi:MAG: hypothetical protein GY747_11415 [Planctomycetes bacterium]|nr:hypothetical protein [Planctomycetota bacterium]MCP4772239.1 hypothetical protein [Planctomycetota bacterium]MCP4861295.1 hypothetical protein [Planctomycetota bacterium]
MDNDGRDDIIVGAPWSSSSWDGAAIPSLPRRRWLHRLGSRRRIDSA